MIFKYFKNSLSDHMVGCRTTFLNRFDHLDGYRGLLTKVSGFLSAEETVVNRFDHLDGYRGLLAIFVVITHCVWDFELHFFQFLQEDLQIQAKLEIGHRWHGKVFLLDQGIYLILSQYLINLI